MSASWPEIEGFPMREDVPAGRKLNLGCGAMILPHDEGWINADRNAAPGVDVRWDFWTLPWPLASDAFEYVLMCHLAEHVPHQVRASVDARGIMRKYGLVPAEFQPNSSWTVMPHRDEGWVAVFREVHRILRPGGCVNIVSPYGQSEGAMQDPTHTRFIVPRTFAYFSEQDTPDYDVGYKFALRDLELIAPRGTIPEGMTPQQVEWEMHTRFNIARTITATLVKV